MNYDLFGINLKLNVGGKENVQTCGGLALTAIMVVIVFAFGTIKLQYLINKTNPNITEVNMQNYFDSKYIVDFDILDFKFAWGVENVYSNEPLQD